VVAISRNRSGLVLIDEKRVGHYDAIDDEDDRRFSTLRHANAADGEIVASRDRRRVEDHIGSWKYRRRAR
jgi:hypothetical protein